jgi:hypothetical protein
MSRHSKFLTQDEVETVRRALGLRIPINEGSAPMSERDTSIFAEAVGIAIAEALGEHRAEDKATITALRQEIREMQLQIADLRLAAANRRLEAHGAEPVPPPKREPATAFEFARERSTETAAPNVTPPLRRDLLN